MHSDGLFFFFFWLDCGAVRCGAGVWCSVLWAFSCWLLLSWLFLLLLMVYHQSGVRSLPGPKRFWQRGHAGGDRPHPRLLHVFNDTKPGALHAVQWPVCPHERLKNISRRTV